MEDDSGHIPGRKSPIGAPLIAGRWRRAGAAAALLAVLGLLGGPGRKAQAQAKVAEISADGLSIRIDSRWAGGGSGGYWPIRLQVFNTGQTRELTFRFKPDRPYRVPTVRRTVRSAGNSTLAVTLAVPLVGVGYRGDLQVLDEHGREIEGLDHGIQLPQLNEPLPGAPAVLIVGQADVNTTSLDLAAAAIAPVLPAYRRHPSRRAGRALPSIGVERIEPAALPAAWVDYSALDLVFLDLPTLEGLPRDRRSALLQWVHCGGTLVVHGLGTSPGKSARLSKLLELPAPRFPAERWTPPKSSLRKRAAAVIGSIGVPQSGGAGGAAFGSGVVAEIPPLNPPKAGRKRPASRAPLRTEFRWKTARGRPPFATHRLMLGTVVAFRDDPFDGTPYDWSWLLATLDEEGFRWGVRHGFSARGETANFVEFLIPGVKGVPVYSFLFLITAFTILIGPLNYFLMWKRKRLFLLVATIPFVAFATSLALFGYSAISHGFDVKTRVRSLTVLDQRSQRAVSVSRVAMFAGFPPSEGLQFSPQTAVFPIWPPEKQFDSGVVDWTDGQQLRSGFLQSRTRTQFLAVTHRRERGRLEISAPRDGRLEVSSGFAWTLDALLVVDDEGRPWFARSLEPGGSATLHPATSDDLHELKTLLRSSRLEPPSDFNPRRRGRGIFGIRPPRWPRGLEQRLQYDYSDSLAERRIAALQELELDARGRIVPGPNGLGPRTYLAVLPQSPGIDLGVEDATEVQGYHLLIGLY